jgi:hypothetical protein
VDQLVSPLVAQPGARPRHPRLSLASGPLRLIFRLRDASGKIAGLAFVSSNSENISYIAFLKQKKVENRELALWHLVNRLVLENA